ncbi:cell division protein FtsA [Candidatus Saccharibacteria bacterium]|nr:cell division protein FtsA [Candidatus Saccharibacteria bacterium]
MDDKARFVVGLDIGSNFVRAAIGEMTHDGIRVVGYGEAPSDGVRRGVISDINAPSVAIDHALVAAEKMSGLEAPDAAISINGANITSTKVDGMIAVGVADHEIDDEDLDRIIDTSIAGKVPATRQILKNLPYEYILDGQGGIREPIGMKGARLEMRANVVSTMKLDFDNIIKTCSVADLQPSIIEPAVLAASRAVLTSHQKENGVAVIDMGGGTTSIAIYDEGELQYVGVCPYGSNDVTNDLAAYLKTIPDIAEEIKLRFVSCDFGEGSAKDIVIKRGRDEYSFSRKDVDEVVESRLEEIFEIMRKHLKHAGYDRRLPEGIILTGGGAKMKAIDTYVRSQMELAVRIGVPINISGVSEDVSKPEFATAIGLMYADYEASLMGMKEVSGKTPKKKKNKGEGGIRKILNLFK